MIYIFRINYTKQNTQLKKRPQMLLHYSLVNGKSYSAKPIYMYCLACNNYLCNTIKFLNYFIFPVTMICVEYICLDSEHVEHS